MIFSHLLKLTLLSSTVYALPAFSQQNPTEKMLNDLSQQLDQHEYSLSTMAYLKNYEKALNAQVESSLSEKNELIDKYQKISKVPQDKKLDFQERFHRERQKREISGLLQAKNQDVQKLEERLAQKKFKYQNLEKLFIEQEKTFHHTVESLTEHISQLTHALERQSTHQQTEPNPESQKILDEYFMQLALARKMKGELEHKTQTISHYKEELGLKNKAYDELLNVNRKLSNALTHAENKIEYLAKANKGLNEKLVALESDYQSLQRYTINLERDFTLKETSLQGEIAAITHQFQQFKMALSNNQSMGRFPASVIEKSLEESKDELSAQIRAKLEEAKISIKQESKNRFSISVDDQYFFENDGKSINALHQAKLNALISLLTDELFTQENMKQRLVSFDIIGHASPRYQGQYVNPANASHEAYAHNLRLSLERARHLADVLFSDNFGVFAHKEFLRQKLRVMGKSFSQPVANRDIASQSSGPCGVYDCHKSRRVEIIFQLDSIESETK